MPGINTGSFFSRMAGQMPGMMNSLAQNYGASDMAQGVRASSALLNRKPKAPKMPKITNGIPKGKMPGTVVPRPTIPEMSAQMPMMKSAPTGGIDTAPRFGIPGGMDFVTGGRGSGGFWNPNAPILDPMTGQYSTPNNAPEIGGLFGRYNRFATPGMRF